MLLRLSDDTSSFLLVNDVPLIRWPEILSPSCAMAAFSLTKSITRSDPDAQMPMGQMLQYNF